MTHYNCLAIAPNYYGKGNTVAEAKARFKQEGGSLTEYIAYELPAESDDATVNGFGQVAWSWPQGYKGERRVELPVVEQPLKGKPTKVAR